jgi:hypothetical protein
MMYEIDGVEYTMDQLQEILSGNSSEYCDSDGNPIQSLQDAALEIMESLEVD